eukprot:TRINITY_DN7670_c0_g1_i1.p1 TRINITY_DN7670_c0_g1~~TRINITY_DN7670_c0_g1_i1.p1  ORF type:complete len:199 (+),score=69.40 TRINITY_DN7670_c0_g1_i1:36-599(+)
MEVKNELKSVIDWSLNKDQNPTFKKYNINPACGGLLYGPSDFNKRDFAEGIARESGINFKCVDLSSGWDQSSFEERNLTKEFDEAIAMQPCLLLLHNLDKAMNSDRFFNQLLTEVDGTNKKELILLATTINPKDIPSTLLRPGRFELVRFVGSFQSELKSFEERYQPKFQLSFDTTNDTLQDDDIYS